VEDRQTFDTDEFCRLNCVPVQLGSLLKLQSNVLPPSSGQKSENNNLHSSSCEHPKPSLDRETTPSAVEREEGSDQEEEEEKSIRMDVL
jgi:hypothetical protein